MKRIILVLVLLCLLPRTVLAAAPEVESKSALLMELTTGQVLGEQNPDEPLAPASVTKIMTMLLIMEANDSGALSWDDTVTVTESAAAKGGSQVYLKVGETMSVSDMVKSIAVSSANDCACAMAEHIAGSEAAFVDLMNARAKELGMANTHFVNCTGLDDSPEAAQHRTTARDIAIMSRELIGKHPDIVKYTTIWTDSIRNGAFGLSNTNKLVRFYPGATGLKTGFTSGAGYCLSATAQREGLQLIAVVMGAETSAKRFTSCKQLLDYGFASFALYTPELGQVTLPVVLGKEDRVALTLADHNPLLVEKGKKAGITAAFTLEEQLAAPVAPGARAGTMTISSGGEVLAEIPIIAASGVEKLTLWDQFLRLLSQAAFGSAGPTANASRTPTETIAP